MMTADKSSCVMDVPCVNQQAEDCASDLNDQECECGTMTSVKNTLTEHKDAKTNATDILGYVDPGGEAECASCTVDGVSSSADVPEGFTFQICPASCYVTDIGSKTTTATNKTDCLGVNFEKVHNDRSDSTVDSGVIDDQSEPVTEYAAHVSVTNGPVCSDFNDGNTDTHLSSDTTTDDTFVFEADENVLSVTQRAITDYLNPAGCTGTGCAHLGITYQGDQTSAAKNDGLSVILIAKQSPIPDHSGCIERQEAGVGDTVVAAGTDCIDTGDAHIDTENFAESEFTETDLLISLTAPEVLILLSAGCDGDTAGVCQSKECSPNEVENNAITKTEESEDKSGAEALGCGTSYSLASTELTCCEGPEPQAGCFCASPKKDENGNKTEFAEQVAAERLDEHLGKAAEAPGILGGTTMSTDILGTAMYSEPKTLMCGTTGSKNCTTNAIYGEGAPHYIPSEHGFHVGETGNCQNGVTTLTIIEKVAVHVSGMSQECGQSPAELGIERHEGTTAGECSKVGDTAANTVCIKNSGNQCLLILDTLAQSALFCIPLSEEVSEHTVDDESAETIFKNTCSCKCSSNVIDCKKVVACVGQANKQVSGPTVLNKKGC